ncbi:hypothetical protein GCM10027590_05970 [Nocardiopsis nanhaiensis]
MQPGTKTHGLEYKPYPQPVHRSDTGPARPNAHNHSPAQAAKWPGLPDSPPLYLSDRDRRDPTLSTPLEKVPAHSQAGLCKAHLVSLGASSVPGFREHVDHGRTTGFEQANAFPQRSG